MPVSGQSAPGLDTTGSPGFIMRSRCLFLCLGLLSCSVSPLLLAQTVTPASPPLVAVQLPQALQAAQQHPDVNSAKRQVSGAQADIRSADRAPLPVFSASVSQIDLQNGNGVGNAWTDKTYDKSVGLDWTWERGNKRDLRTQGARRNADAAQADLEETSLQLKLAALQAFYDLLAAQERVNEITQIEQSAAELARAAKVRLQAGDLSAQDSARMEIDAQRARADLRQAQLEQQRAALVLWQLTLLSPGPTQLQAQANWPQATAPGSADIDALVEARSDVRAAQARTKAARAALEGSQALKKSDITVGVAYDHYPGTSTALMTVRMSMPLQWGYGYEGEIGRATAQLGIAEDSLERTRRQARSELQRLWQEVLSTAERAQTFDNEILPRARRVAEGAELAYRKGASSLTDLLDARRTLRATVLDTVAARNDYAKALGAWRLRSGTDLAALQ